MLTLLSLVVNESASTLYNFIYCFSVFDTYYFCYFSVLFIKSPNCRVLHPTGWSQHDMTCYNFDVRGNFSWSECKSECTSLGASMHTRF